VDLEGHVTPVGYGSFILLLSGSFDLEFRITRDGHAFAFEF